MWSFQKSLSNIINDVVVNKKHDIFPMFKETLNSNMSSLLNILKDKVKIFFYYFISKNIMY
jgi:hypothetical protein